MSRAYSTITHRPSAKPSNRVNQGHPDSEYPSVRVAHPPASGKGQAGLRKWPLEAWERAFARRIADAEREGQYVVEKWRRSAAMQIPRLKAGLHVPKWVFVRLLPYLVERCFCGGVALYRVSTDGYCKKHRDYAVTRRFTSVSKPKDQAGTEIEKMANVTDQILRKLYSLHATRRHRPRSSLRSLR